jgi:hypothetical protein
LGELPNGSSDALHLLILKPGMEREANDLKSYSIGHGQMTVL